MCQQCENKKEYFRLYVNWNRNKTPENLYELNKFKDIACIGYKYRNNSSHSLDCKFYGKYYKSEIPKKKFEFQGFKKTDRRVLVSFN